MGVALLGGLILAVSILYFVLRDGTPFWAGSSGAFTPETQPRSTGRADGHGTCSAVTSGDGADRGVDAT